MIKIKQSRRVKIKVYIAGPYTKPDPASNVLKAMTVWKQLFDLGYAPYCPHWTHFQEQYTPMPYEKWREYDDEFIGICQAFLRIPGESTGADEEAQLAKSMGIPVFYSIAELVAAMPPVLEE